MQSPLSTLLDAIKRQTDCSAIAASQASNSPFDAAANAAWEAALGTGSLLSDVLAIALQPNVQGCVPDADHVASCKQRGTDAFGRQQHHQAAALFSEALRYCDEGSPEGASLAARLYCNRALCLSRLQPPQLHAAVQDAAAAIACDPSFPKAWYRRAWAAHQLIQERGSKGCGTACTASALADARRALQLLQEQGSQDTGQAAHLVAQLEAAAAATPGAAAAGHAPATSCAVLVSECDIAADHPTNEHASEHDSTSASAPPSLLACAGRRLHVAEQAGAGRCLAAADELPAGVDVLREQPFVHALTKLGRRTVCATCCTPLAKIPAPFCCPRCPVAQYCTAACRDADAFHTPGGPECGRPWPVLLPCEAVAALRLARRLRAADEQASAAASQVALLGTHFAELRVEDVAELAALATVAHAAWNLAAAEAASAGKVASGSSTAPALPANVALSSGEERRDRAGPGGITAGDVLEALCRLQINGLAIVPAERHGSMDRLGLALYSVGSLMNHACLPNVATRFEGSTLVVRTIAPLAAGAPLLHCYGPQAGEMTAAQRQTMLEQQYFFRCRCRACTSAASGDAQHAVADAAPAGLRCLRGRGSAGTDTSGQGQCNGAVLSATPVAPGVMHRYALPPGTGACCACGTPLSAALWEQTVGPALQAAADAYADAVSTLEHHDRQQDGAAPPREAAAATAAAAQHAVRALRQCLRLRQQHLHPHNLLLGATHDALARAWHLAGNTQAAAQHLRHSVGVVAHAYPAGSTAVAFQRRELARMLRLAVAQAAPGSSGVAVEQLLSEAREAEEEADVVLELHFGPGLALDS